MPVRSSLCTYSPSAGAGSASSSGKYSSILPTASSLSYGQYKPLTSSGTSSNSSSFRSTPTASPGTTSTLGRYSRLASHHAPSSYSPSSSSSYSPSSYSPSSTSSTSTSSSVGHYKPFSPSSSSSSSSAHNSSFSSRYGSGGTSYLTTTTSSASPSTRYSASSSSSTGSLASSLSAGSSDSSSYHHYKSPLSSSAYSSGASLASSASSYTSPYTSRASRRLSSSGVSSSSGSAASAPLPAGVPCGLVNLGNTCYMNASLQSLYALETFRNLVLSRVSSSAHDKVLTHELSEVFKLLKASGNGEPQQQATSPVNFKYAFSRYQTKFSGFGQQDAQEFLRYLINGIHEESNAAAKRPRRTRALQAPRSAQEAWSQYRDVVDDSPLVDLLVGQLCSTITCCECQNKSHCWDPFWDLSLPLMTRGSGAGSGSTYSWRRATSQLSDVIDEFTSKEVLDSDERPVCSQCKRATKSTKQISLARLPRVMILHLKKFTNDGYKLTSGSEIQINKQLEFAGSSTAYQLKACISHHGHSSSSGHYTAHCEYAGRWYHFDDGRVRDVTQTFDSAKLDDAYVLFYTQSRATASSLSQSKL